MIKRRLFYQIAGYDPVGAEGHHRRFTRGLPTFARTWNVTATASELTAPTEDTPARWTVTTQAPNWRVEATYQPLAWDDIVLAGYAKPMLRRVAGFLLALFDIFRTGTVFRYFRANVRYGLFFLFPVIYLIGFVAVGYFLGRGIANWLQLQGAAHALTVAAIGLAAFFLLLQWPGRRWRVIQALDDWIFSWEYLHGRRPDIEARIDRYAQLLVESACDSQFDEIVVAGHSLGATLAINIVARAIERDPALGTRGPRVCVLTVGSTIPKFTLHPDAHRVRRDAERVASAPAVEWAEYHARVDPISFHKFDPVTGPVAGDRLDRKPLIRVVRIRGMLEEATYKRIRFRFMRVHHQFVMANERRNAYDFYMMGCGPIPFDRAVMTPGGPEALIGADGAMLEPDVADHATASARR